MALSTTPFDAALGAGIAGDPTKSALAEQVRVFAQSEYRRNPADFDATSGAALAAAWADKLNKIQVGAAGSDVATLTTELATTFNAARERADSSKWVAAKWPAAMPADLAGFDALFAGAKNPGEAVRVARIKLVDDISKQYLASPAAGPDPLLFVQGTIIGADQDLVNAFDAALKKRVEDEARKLRDAEKSGMMTQAQVDAQIVQKFLNPNVALRMDTAVKALRNEEYKAEQQTVLNDVREGKISVADARTKLGVGNPGKLLPADFDALMKGPKDAEDVKTKLGAVAVGADGAVDLSVAYAAIESSSAFSALPASVKAILKGRFTSMADETKLLNESDTATANAKTAEAKMLKVQENVADMRAFFEHAKYVAPAALIGLLVVLGTMSGLGVVSGLALTTGGVLGAGVAGVGTWAVEKNFNTAAAGAELEKAKIQAKNKQVQAQFEKIRQVIADRSLKNMSDLTAIFGELYGSMYGDTKMQETLLKQLGLKDVSGILGKLGAMPGVGAAAFPVAA
jgi:hypothetical protein